MSIQKTSNRQQDAVLFIHWDRAVAGRETHAAELFQSTLAFFAKEREAKRIDSYEPIMLGAHGGNLNGFILVRGQSEQLDTLQREEGFVDIVVNASTVLTRVGVLRGYGGAKLQNVMERWGRHTKRFVR